MMTKDKDFKLTIDLEPLRYLDEFALLSCQKYNYGNESDWFGTFRGGLKGFYSRIFGVETHYRDVHIWIPKLRLPIETEYHTSSILFGMDSAIECFVFTLNALGNAGFASDFIDVTDGPKLRDINPENIRSQICGYSRVFPTLQNHWISNWSLIKRIMEHHQVSKHREAICSGGKGRQDPPPGFYDKLQVRDNPKLQVLLSPSSEILLTSDPKEPRIGRSSTAYEDRVVLETIVKDFCSFINQSCLLSLNDARDNIPLNHNELQKG